MMGALVGGTLSHLVATTATGFHNNGQIQHRHIIIRRLMSGIQESQHLFLRSFREIILHHLSEFDQLCFRDIPHSRSR